MTVICQNNYKKLFENRKKRSEEADKKDYDRKKASLFYNSGGM